MQIYFVVILIHGTDHCYDALTIIVFVSEYAVANIVNTERRRSKGFQLPSAPAQKQTRKKEFTAMRCEYSVLLDRWIYCSLFDGKWIVNNSMCIIQYKWYARRTHLHKKSIDKKDRNENRRRKTRLCKWENMLNSSPIILMMDMRHGRVFVRALDKFVTQNYTNPLQRTPVTL